MNVDVCADMASIRELVEVKIEKMYPDVELPEYKHDDDSGMDVKAYFSDEWVKKNHLVEDELNIHRFHTIPGGVRTIIPTGIKVAIPNGYEIQVRPLDILPTNEFGGF